MQFVQILRALEICLTGLKRIKRYLQIKVVTYCTGGIRCEKFSGWLLKEGFEDVAQLHGGIATYGKDPETKGQYWDGKMYVFDDRISVDINQVEKRLLVRIGLMANHVNVILIALTQNVINKY